MKKSLLKAAAVAVTVMGIAGIYYMAPSQYLAVDINPSIEIKTNRLNQVTSIKGTNEDAKRLLKGYELKERGLEYVLEDVIDLLDDGGYFTNEDKNDILLTVKSGSASEKTVKRVNEHLSDYLKACQIEGRILEQHVWLNEELKKLAEENHISAGRMSLIEQILSKDGKVTADQLAGMRISDLILYADEMGISIDHLEDQLDSANDVYRNENLERLEDELDRIAEKNEVRDDRDDDDDRYDDKYDRDDDKYDHDDKHDHDDDRYDRDDDDDRDDRYDDDDDHDDDDHDDYDDRDDD